MLNEITSELIAGLADLSFGPPTAYVYNPLVYANKSWTAYCDRYGQGRREILLVGMNPGPFGMAQVGVPFGEVSFVRDWLKVEAKVDKPPHEHPQRPIVGFDCKRSEVSGFRFWGWAKDCYVSPAAFFERFFVANYCPLVFMEESGRNRTPDKLPVNERLALFRVCDRALEQTVRHFQPKFVIGVGKFAKERIVSSISSYFPDIVIGSVPHPSPASPIANTGWDRLMTQALADLGVA